jgi:hypothetical protein
LTNSSTPDKEDNHGEVLLCVDAPPHRWDDCILSLPWLGLIALMIVVLVALPALALAIVSVPYLLGRAITRRWHGRSEAVRRAASALPVYGHPRPAFRRRAVS